MFLIGNSSKFFLSTYTQEITFWFILYTNYRRICQIISQPLILTESFQHNLINVSYLTAWYLYQVMLTLHFLNDVANDAESIQK